MDSKERFDSNPQNCDLHEDEIVYTTIAGREQVHQCLTCGCAYVHNLETDEFYG